MPTGETTFLTCSLCLTLPEGHCVLSADEGTLARRGELRSIWSSPTEGIFSCPSCGTLYLLEITPIDSGFWAAVVDPYDVPTDPHQSMTRPAPSRGEELLAQHAPAQLGPWRRHVEEHRHLFTDALAQAPVGLDDLRLRHALKFLIDLAGQDELVALVEHADLRVVLFTAQELVYPRATVTRFAPAVTARLAQRMPSLKDALSRGLLRCLGAEPPYRDMALELIRYARRHLHAQVLSAAAAIHAANREGIVSRLDAPSINERLVAIRDLMKNLDGDVARSHPKVAERFACALREGLADRTRAIRRDALGIVQQWTVADRHLDLFRPVLPEVAVLLTDDALCSYAEDALVLHFTFYDRATHQALRALLAHRDDAAAGAARRVLQSWAWRLRQAHREPEAAWVEADLRGAPKGR